MSANQENHYVSQQAVQSNTSFQAVPPMCVNMNMPMFNMPFSKDLNFEPDISTINVDPSFVPQPMVNLQPMINLWSVPGFTPMLYDPVTNTYSHILPTMLPQCEPFVTCTESSCSDRASLSSLGEYDYYQQDNVREAVSSFGSEDLNQHDSQKKFPFRSKQRKIEKVRNFLEHKYQSLGLFAAEKELVRGVDTIRVHVKTFPGLTQITKALAEIEDNSNIQICRIACPYSKKNKKQKKGFIVYLKVGSAQQAKMVQGIFQKYEPALKNCVIALPRELKEAQAVKDIEMDDFSSNQNPLLTPCAMIKRSSGGA